MGAAQLTISPVASRPVFTVYQPSLWRLDPSGERPAARLPFVGQDAIMPVLSGSIPGKPIRLVYVRRC